MLLTTIIVVLVVFFIIFMLNNTYESFGSGETESPGSYLITWDPPSNVDPSDPTLSYHIIITDGAENKILDKIVPGSSTSYKFDTGNWDTDYSVSVSAILADPGPGEGSAASVSFTSGEGVFPIQITKPELTFSSEGGVIATDIGDSFDRISIIFSTDSKDRLNYDGNAGDTKVFGSIRYTYANNTKTCTWVLGEVELKDNGNQSVITLKPYYLGNASACSTSPDISGTLPVHDVDGQQCLCTIPISPNDNITVSLQFSNEFGKSNYSNGITFTQNVPNSPENITSQWSMVGTS